MCVVDYTIQHCVSNGFFTYYIMPLSYRKLGGYDGNRSTIITSQLPVAQWYEAIGEQTVADTILDRIVHDAHRIELLGESLRKSLKNKITENVETI